MTLVEFDLSPLEEIEPWGAPPDLSLHWFALSLGEYCLNVGRERLLEYAAAPQRVEYQVARIHEDILAMLPDVLDELPKPVVDLLPDASVGTALKQLNDKWQASDAPNEGLELTLEVLGARVLDTGYLTPSARIWVWRCGDQVVIEWDNRGTLVDDKPVWTATRGRCELERSTYVREIRSFHDRLMARMDDRVDSVTKSWRRSDVLLDPDALRQDCRERATWLDAALARPPRDRDWSEIARVLAEHVKRGAG